MKPMQLRVGDVVQLAPGPNTFFGGCFMLVTEPKDWGAQGFIAIPGKRGEIPGEAYCRTKWEEMEYIGHAAWVPKNYADDGAI